MLTGHANSPSAWPNANVLRVSNSEFQKNDPFIKTMARPITTHLWAKRHVEPQDTNVGVGPHPGSYNTEYKSFSYDSRLTLQKTSKIRPGECVKAHRHRFLDRIPISDARRGRISQWQVSAPRWDSMPI